MKSFSEKIKEARAELELSQLQLGNIIGVSVRSIIAYEKGDKKPRKGTLLKLAKALKVSVRFLSDSMCDNPLEDIEKDGYIEYAREHYGRNGEKDIENLLKENSALFAGGKYSQEQKDAFFEAIMKAYITCKEEAKSKYGKNK